MTREEQLEYALKQLKAHVSLISEENNKWTVTDPTARHNIDYSVTQCNTIIESVLQKG